MVRTCLLSNVPILFAQLTRVLNTQTYRPRYVRYLQQ